MQQTLFVSQLTKPNKREGAKLKVVSFVNMKGGVAKTTLSVNFADCISRRHDLKVLLIDIDPQFNATQCLLSGDEYKEKREKYFHTIVDIFDDSPRPIPDSVNGVSMSEPLDIENIKPWQINDRFFILPGALELHRLDMAGGQGRENRLKIYTEHLRQNKEFDVIVIDTPPTPSAWMSAALIASDYYIVPVKPEPLSATGIDLLKSIINMIKKNYSLKLKCAGVVLTIAEKHTIVFDDAIEFIDNNKFWKGKRLKRHLPKRTIVARKQGEQGLILDINDDELKLSLAMITNEIVDRIKLEN